MNERVNLKFLGWSLLAFGIVAGSWFGVHALQMRQHTGALLALADRSEKEGKLNRALRLLGQYILLEPEDVEARIRYGQMLENAPDGPRLQRAAAVYQQVLLRAPDREDIRLRVARLNVTIGDFDEALRHLEKLEKDAEDNLKSVDPEVNELFGRCREAKGRYADAAGFYQKAIADPKRIDSYVRCARLLQQRLSQPVDADDLMNDMVAKNNNSYRAYLERVEYRKEFHLGKAGADEREDLLVQSEMDAAEAQELAPAKAEPLRVSAEVALEQRYLKYARRFLEKGIEEHPKETALYQALAAVENAANRPTEAIAHLRRGLETAPEDQTLLFSLAQLLIQKGEKSYQEVEEIIDRLRKLRIASVYPDFLKARLAFVQGKWYQASLLLETVQQALVDAPRLAEPTYLLLAQCYEQMGVVDRQLDVYRQALRTNPLNPNVRLALATLLARVGRLDAAIEETRQVLSFANAPAASWVLLARLLLAQNLARPPAQQDQYWKVVETALEKAQKANPDSAEVRILHSEILFARKKPELAWEYLEKAREEKLKPAAKAQLGIALADLALRQGQLDRARTALEEAEKAAGDEMSLSLRLARARYALRQNDDERAKILTRLADSVDKFSPEDQARLLSGLAGAWLQAGTTEQAQRHSIDEARRLWRRLAELQPQDLQVRLLLFDAALRSDDEGDMLKQIEAIRRIEEAGGPLGHYAAASHLFWRAQKLNEKGSLDEAKQELAAAASRRPNWDKVYLLRGGIAELQGDEGAAIDHYKQAVAAGNRQQPVLERLLRLLYQRQQFTEADLVLRQLPEQAGFSAEMQQMISEMSLQSGDVERALAAARKAVDTNSNDVRKQLWLGQMLSATRRTKEAEEVLRRAVQLSKDDPSPSVALVQLLARTEQLKQAEEVLHQAEKKLPRQKALLAFAQAYEAVGKMEEAEKLYEEAIAAQSTNLAVRQSAANFYLRNNQRAKAKHELEEILQLKDTPAETAAQTRRFLAVVLANQGDYQQQREALKLMGLLDKGSEPAQAKKADYEELRAQAVVLARQPKRAQKLQAIRMIQQLAEMRPLPPEERFLLVQLHEQVGQSDLAREQMLKLLAAQGNDPRYLSYQVQMQLRQGHLDEAEGWLRPLEKAAPKAPRTVELKARLLKAQKQPEQIVPLLTAYLSENPTVSILSAANLYESLGLIKEAEKLYRKHAAEKGKPRNALALAEFLARQKRTREALDVCQAAWQNCPPLEVANTCTSVLHIASANAEECRRVQGWIEEALKKKDAPATSLLVCLAYVHDLAGNYSQAESIYRKVLSVDRKKVDALNNLAWLLSYQKGRADEALRLAERAVEIIGPLPELADTRAIALLALQRTNEAIVLLEDTLDQVGLAEETRMLLYFHLALAQQMAGQRAEAEKALKSAKQAGLDESKLHPLERPALRQLLAAVSAS